MIRGEVVIGVIGCGYWGPNLIRNFRSIPEVRVKKICDIDDNRLKHMKTLYPEIKTTTEYDQLIYDNEIDAVAIATPVRTHFGIGQNLENPGPPTTFLQDFISIVSKKTSAPFSYGTFS